MSQPQEASNLTEHTMGKKHLPQPRGPHSVGFVDLLTSGDTGVLVRIYYPTKVREMFYEYVNVQIRPQWARKL